jgi:plasmid rolling circle replication initiator protein Rep
MKNTNKDQKSQRENQLGSLIDLKPTGKRRNWDKAKRMSLAVSTAYSQNVDLERYGEKIKSCGNYLKFKACTDVTHGKKLVDAYFCKCRQCVMCQGRKSNVIRKQVIDLTREHLARYSTDVPLLLTLTVPNEPGSNMIKTIDQMTAAWKRLMQLKVVKEATRSWFRSLEITYNPDRDDFHPHFHAVLMVPKVYFLKKSGLYITRDEWLKLWQQSMRDDRITQVDIRRIQSKDFGEIEAFVGEAAKYATKPSSYILENEIGKYEADPQVVSDLHYAIRGRRLVAYGGLFSQIRKEKKMEDVEKADLVNVDGDIISSEHRLEDVEKADLVNVDGDIVSSEHRCKICESELVEEVYRWNFGAEQYRRAPLRGQEDVEDFQETETVYEDSFPQEEKENTSHYNVSEGVRGSTSYGFEEESPMVLRISLDGMSHNEPFPLLRGPP